LKKVSFSETQFKKLTRGKWEKVLKLLLRKLPLELMLSK